MSKITQTFTTLTQVFILDAHHKIDTAKVSATQQEKCKSDMSPSTVFLESSDGLWIGYTILFEHS